MSDASVQSAVEAVAIVLHTAFNAHIDFVPPWWGEFEDMPVDHLLADERDKACFRALARAALAAMPAASEGEVLLPANPGALAMSIEIVDRFIDDDDSHVLHPEVGESIMLVVHELKRLRAAPAASDQEKMADLLTKAVGDIAAALTMAGKQAAIAAWSKPYVDALNEFDTRLRTAGEGAGS